MEAKRTVWVALSANALIAVGKFVAAGASGSAAMLSEGVHSVVDTLDQALLLLGRRRSRRPPDGQHPFGHGQELYFWTTLVATVIFGAGGGVSFYEGLLHVLHAEQVSHSWWSYAALGLAAIAEGTSLAVAVRGLRRHDPKRPLWRIFRTSKDPSALTVLFEDSAALVGIAFALAGVALSQLFGRSWIDGAAAMAIGLLLMSIAVLLLRESKSLVVGEAADPALVARLRRILEDDPEVRWVARLLTMHFGPDAVLLAVDLEFSGELTADSLGRVIDRLEARITAECPEVKQIFVEAQALRRSARTDAGTRPEPVPA